MAERQNIIYTDNLQHIRPLIWHGQEVYAKYEQIVSVIEARLGSEVVQLFTRPVVPEQEASGDGEAHWLAAGVRAPVPLTSLAQSEQETYSAQLSHALNQVLALGQELQQSSQAGERELGEVLQLAVEVPTLDYVLVEKGRVVLVCWGFQLAEADERERFRLVKALDAAAPEVEATGEPSSPQPPPETPPEDPPRPGPPSSSRRGYGRWVLAVLGGLLVLVVLGWLLYLWLAPAPFPSEPGFQPADPDRYGEHEDEPLGRDIVLGQLLVILEDGEDTRKVLEQHAREWRQEGIQVVGYRPPLGLVQVEVDGELEKAKAYLRDFDEVVDATVVPVDEVEQYEPSDPGFDTGEASRKDWGYHAINAFEAWGMERGNEDVLVAIIDTDFDVDHPEFAGSRISAYNIATGEWGLEPTPDGNAHGSHVAATAIGAIDNDAGVAGTCPQCSALLIDAGGGVGRFAQTDLIEAMELAMNEGADVVNLSLGLSMPPGMDPEVVKRMTRGNERIRQRIIGHLESNGVVVVRSAGNDNVIASVDPGNRVDESFVVGAFNPQGAPASFTNHGEVVDLGAPGQGIYSAETGGHGFKNGTSMAAPFVAGAVGLLRSVDAELTPKEIRELLVRAAQPAPNEDPDRPIGQMLDLAAAVRAASERAEQPSNPGRQPTQGCDCEELERRIAELERRLDELEDPEGDEPEPRDRMVIPDDPEDLEFAAGVWRASEGLYRDDGGNTVDIELEFRIQADGRGSMRFEEPGGNCPASLDVELNGRTLSMEQRERARCNHRGGQYNRYRYNCEAQADGLAVCRAHNLVDPDQELVRFFMERQ